MDYIYINGNSKVAIETVLENEITTIVKVFVDGKEQLFEAGSLQDKGQFATQAKREKYKQFLNNQFENLIVLSGAGSSKDVGGLLLTELWDETLILLGEQKLMKLCSLVHYEYEDSENNKIKNLEKLLSLANAAKDYVVDNDINIPEIINDIKSLIKSKCQITLSENTPHEMFLEKISKRKVTLPRAKIFTINYDTLFEQAGRRKNFTIIDGFSFSFPRIFSGRNFDYDIVIRDKSRVKEEDNFIRRVFHLYKPHGSIDWERLPNGTVKQSENVDNPLMIFPNESKYENSFEQPFFEMMSRFQQNLRRDNVLLLCIGFSFNDKHIVTAIKEALEQNPGFQLMVVNKGIDTSDHFKWLYELAHSYSNIVLVDELFTDFASNYPDLRTYNQDEHKKIVILNKENGHE